MNGAAVGHRRRGRRRVGSLPSPSHTTSLARALGIAPRGVHAFVGAGGKTSCIRRLLQECPHAVATTTTHLARTAFGTGLLACFPSAARLQEDFAALWSSRPLTLGVLDGERLRGPDPSWYEMLRREQPRTLLLVEADGAARRLLKMPGPHEPAWPPGPLRRAVIVVGLAALGRPLTKVAHHPRRFGAAEVVRLRHVERMVRAYLDAAPPTAPVTVLCTGVAPPLDAAAERLARRCVEWIGRRDPRLRDPGVSLRFVATEAIEARGFRVWKLPRRKVPSTPALPGVCGVLLAAGLGSRFRRLRPVESKLLVPWHGRPLLEHGAEAFARAGFAAWLAVTGHAAHAVEKALRQVARQWRTPLRIVRNPSPARGLGSSVRLAARAAPPGMGLLFGHGDMPSVSVATLRRVASWGSSMQHSIVVPEVHGKPSHPVYFPSVLRRDLQQVPDSEGGRAVIRARASQVASLPLPASAASRDVDVPADLMGSRREPAAHRVLFIGCGDLGSGAAHALVRAGFPVAIVELATPRAVRRRVSFAEAARAGATVVEGVPCKRVTLSWLAQAWPNWAGHRAGRRRPAQGFVPLVVDSWQKALRLLQPTVIVDARLAKSKLPRRVPPTVFHVALGPGHVAGEDCDAVVETLRGEALGRVIWRGEAARDTGVPGSIGGVTKDRVLRAPVAGVLRRSAAIGRRLRSGEVVAWVGTRPVRSPITGILRGMLASGDRVGRGQKLGDVDPRQRPPAVSRISDKSRRVGEGVVQAICTEFGLTRRTAVAGATSRGKRRLRRSRR